MANTLKVAMQQSIITLKERGWSQRRIARELDVDRSTVGRYIRLHLAQSGGESKPAIPTGLSERLLTLGIIPPVPA